MQKVLDYIATGPAIIIAALVFIIGYIILRVIAKVIAKTMKKTKLDISLQKFFVKTIVIVGVIILLICSLATAGISTTGLITTDARKIPQSSFINFDILLLPARLLIIPHISAAAVTEIR